MSTLNENPQDSDDYTPQRLAQLFERSVDGFGTILLQPLKLMLRRQLTEFGSHIADDIAGVWVESAGTLLGEFLPADVAAGLDTAKAAADIHDELKSALGQTLASVDPETMTREALVLAREIAETVLSRWFELLGQAGAGAPAGLPLNAHLLPGTGTVQSALDEVDFLVYGIDNATIANALRLYWDEVLVDSKPVEFGRGLWIVPDLNDWASPYRLFDSGAHARDFASRQQLAPAVETELGERFVSVFAITEQALATEPVAGGAIAAAASLTAPTSLIDCCRTWQLTAQGAAAGAPARSDILVRRLSQRESPEIPFVASVELLYDLVVSVLALRPEDAWRRVRSQRDKVMPLLQSYSQKRKVRLEAVLKAVSAAVSLAAAADRRPGERVPGRFVSSENLHQDINRISRGFAKAKPIGARHLIKAILYASGNLVPTPNLAQLKSIAGQPHEPAAPSPRTAAA